jgi:rSAM/selenodomain-associated transferase 2
MPAPLSVIIPTLNATDQLPQTLQALMEGVEMGLIGQLILSDGGSVDQIDELAEAAGAVLVIGPAGRGGQLHRGALRAQSPWILFLHADTHLAPGWAAIALQHMNTTPEMAGHFTLRFRSAQKGAALVAAGANLRSQWFGLPYGDQGLLMSRALYDRIGGYRDLPLMEDVEIAKSLKGKLKNLTTFAETSATRFEADGWMRRAAANLWTLCRYKFGASPDRLAARYHRPD